jgi:hypothetical protein
MKILSFIKELAKTIIIVGVALMVILSIILMLNGFEWNQYWVLF